jgi:spore germination cell wall hydrolase CwlJ-like protein
MCSPDKDKKGLFQSVDHSFPIRLIAARFNLDGEWSRRLKEQTSMTPMKKGSSRLLLLEKNMGLTSMTRLFGRSSLGIAGFAALLLATGFSALSPRVDPQPVSVAQAKRIPLQAIFSDPSERVQLASLDQATPITLQAVFNEELQGAGIADTAPRLLADTTGPAALPDGTAEKRIRAALKQNVSVADAEGLCLAEAVYFESRGEPLEGQLAVAQVILNRVADKRFANSICGVVRERSPGPSKACQFSFVCDARSDVPAPSRDWNIAQAVAVVARDKNTLDVTDGALFFHADRVSPKWRHRLALTRTVGTHLFYR